MKLAPAADAGDGAESATTATNVESTAIRAHMPGVLRVGARTGLIGNERCDFVTCKLVAALESGELDEEGETDDLTLELLHELDRAGHRSTGREEIVDDEHPRARFDRVPVHLESRRAVLEVVLDAHHIPRQLAELSHRDEANAELVRDRRREDEPPRLHPHDDIDLLRADLREEPVDRGREGVSILEQRGDVFEKDPGLWKVGNVADLAREVLRLHRHGAQISVLPK